MGRHFLVDWRLIFQTFWLHVLQISGSTLGIARNGDDEEFYAGTRAQKTTADQVHACTIIVHTPGIAPQRQRGRSWGGRWLKVLQTQTFFKTKIHYFAIYVSVKSIPVCGLSEQNG